jgi:hypothetical protein
MGAAEAIVAAETIGAAEMIGAAGAIVAAETIGTTADPGTRALSSAGSASDGNGLAARGAAERRGSTRSATSTPAAITSAADTPATAIVADAGRGRDVGSSGSRFEENIARDYSQARTDGPSRRQSSSSSRCATRPRAASVAAARSPSSRTLAGHAVI